MEISEFRVKMRELLDAPTSDEAFWDQCGDLTKAVLKARVDAKRADPRYQERLAASRAQSGPRWSHTQLGPDQLTTTRPPVGPSYAHRQHEYWRRMIVVAGWSGFLWSAEQIGAIKSYVNDGVVTNALPKRYRDGDAASTTTSHEFIARRARKNVVAGWEWQHRTNAAIDAIKAFVETGEIQDELPKMYKDRAVEHGYRGGDAESRRATVEPR
jgi:hypothetical protein